MLLAYSRTYTNNGRAYTCIQYINKYVCSFFFFFTRECERERNIYQLVCYNHHLPDGLWIDYCCQRVRLGNGGENRFEFHITAAHTVSVTSTPGLVSGCLSMTIYRVRSKFPLPARYI